MRTSRQLLKEARRALVAAFVFSGAINLLALVLPIYTLQIFETVVPAGSLETLIALTAMAGVALTALAMLEGVRDRLLLRAGLWLDHVLGEHIVAAGLAATGPGADVKGDVRALSTLKTFLTGGGIAILFDAPWIAAFLLALFALHPVLGLASLGVAGILVLAGLVQIALAARVAGDGQRASDQAEQWLASLAGRSRLIGALGLAGGSTAQWERLNRSQIAANYSLGKRTSVMRAFARSVRMMAQFGIYGLGAWLVIGHELTPGALVAASILLSRALAPLEQSVSVFRSTVSAWTAYRRLQAIADPPRSPRLADTRLSSKAELEARDVTLYHPGRRTPALRTVSLKLAPGEVVAVIGPNGAGKSSLAALLGGVVAPSNGSVQLDGVDIVRWQRTEAIPPVGYLPDAATLIEGTVFENIVRFADRSFLSATRAAMRAGVHDIISALPQGYDTPVGAGGEALSLRERRAVAFARALHGDPRLVVLDEPELGLDGVSVRRLGRTIAGLKAEGVGVVLATQDQRLLAGADRVVLLNAGAVEASGSTAQMVAHLGTGAGSARERLQAGVGP